MFNICFVSGTVLGTREIVVSKKMYRLYFLQDYYTKAENQISTPVYAVKLR